MKYVRPGALLRQKAVIWVIGVVIWSEIRKAWSSFASKSVDLAVLGGHFV